MTHRRWQGPLPVPGGDRRAREESGRWRLLQPVLFDDVARRLVVSGLPDQVGGALLLAVLPSHLVEVGGRRLVARAVEALGASPGGNEPAEGSRSAR